MASTIPGGGIGHGAWSGGPDPFHDLMDPELDGLDGADPSHFTNYERYRTLWGKHDS